MVSQYNQTEQDFMVLSDEAKAQMIKEAIEEADEGMFISEEDMTTWFYSLGTENELPLPEAKPLSELKSFFF